MIPKASSNRIAPGKPLRVYVTAPPADGEANKAVIELLAKWLGVPKSRLTVKRGSTSQNKVIGADDLTDEELARRLSAGS